jgi:hypothetical protein
MKYTEAQKLFEEMGNAESLRCLLEAADRLHRHLSGKVFTSPEDIQRLLRELESCPLERGLIYVGGGCQ